MRNSKTGSHEDRATTHVSRPSPWDDFSALKSTTPFDMHTFTTLCSKDSRILDLGCAYGRICHLLESAGYISLTGVDSSQRQLGRARRALSHTKLVLADVRALPFENEYFDHALALGVLDCLTETRELRRAISECARVLKPGGYWFVNFYTRNSSRYFDEKYAAGKSQFRKKRVFTSNSGLVFRHYTLPEFLAVLDKRFDVIRCELQDFLSMNQRITVAGYCLILRKPVFMSAFR